MKVFFYNLGCPKNLVESESMLTDLVARGHRTVSAPEDADVIIVNTCGFIKTAAQESIDTVLEAARIKEASPGKKIVVAGCLTQRYRESLSQLLPEADIFIGVSETADLGRILSEKDAGPLYCSPEPERRDINYRSRIILTPPHYAYVKIADGCGRKCSFCTIPAIKGKYRSRSVGSIVEECRNLAAEGVKEINLVAQDLTNYGFDKKKRGAGLLELIKAVSRISGISWIRLLYLFPGGMVNEVVDLMSDNEKLCPYLDLPFQHVDSRILKLMSRPHSEKQIYSLIEYARKKIPGITLRTTLITGFPTETEKDFLKMLDFIGKIQFDKLGVFKYSNEEGTPAAALPGRVPEKEKAARQKKLMTLQREVSSGKNRARIGNEAAVIIDSSGAKRLKGRTRGDAPEIDGTVYMRNRGNADIGDIVRVRFTAARDYDMEGIIINEHGK